MILRYPVEGGVEQLGLERADLPFQRTMYRELGCLLWSLFETLAIAPGAPRVLFLRKMVLGPKEIGIGLCKAALVDVLAQTKEVHTTIGAFREVVQRSGVGAAASYAHFTISLMMQKLDGVARLLMLADWAEYGFPVVQVGHKLCASLLVTRVTSGVLAELKLPFPVFEIELPTKTFYTETVEESGREMHELAFALCGTFLGPFVPTTEEARTPSTVQEVRQCFAVLASAATCTLWSVRHTIADLGDFQRFDDADIENMRIEELRNLAHALETTDVDERNIAMLARLFANVCLFMTESGMSKRIGKAHGTPTPAASPRTLRRCPPPQARVFQLTTPVRHDFREVVVDYLRGGGTPPSVQGVVAGHHKMQAIGQGRTGRKRIYVEPYWRGPEDAPIALRPHRAK